MDVVAPGGSIEMIEHVLGAAADEVYFGIGALNARVRAQNLEPAQAVGVVEHVHGHGARAAVALNVPVRPETLAGALEALAVAYWSGTDAVILRDPLLMSLAREFCPDMEVHASTQSGVDSPAAARQAFELGCRRAILARELSLEQIARIHRDVPELELEAFVFGALCFGLSGRCLLGHAVDGRSGNHGACSQVCRLMFFDETGRPLGRILSMKDLDLLPHVGRLAQAGITALKIEGRLKPPAWAACVVHWARKAVRNLDAGGLAPDELARFNDEVSTLYSRPRTDSYLWGRPAAQQLTCPDVSGHQGLDVRDWSVQRRGNGFVLSFVAPVELAVRDGLLLRVRTAASPSGWEERPVALRELLDGAGRRTAVVEEGERVQVRIPHLDGLIGVAIHSAHRVAARYRKMSIPLPESVRSGERPGPRFVSVRLAAGRLELEAVRGRFRHAGRFEVSCSPARNEGLSPSLAARHFGAAAFDLEPGLYVNPSLLKQLRRRFLAAFESEYAAQERTLAERMLAAVQARQPRFFPSDEELLASGPTCVSRVTGLARRVIRTSGGTTFDVIPGKNGTKLCVTTPHR